MNEISNSLCISFASFNKNHKSIQSRMCVVHIKMLRSSIFPRVVLISAWLEIQARNAFYMHRYKLLYWRFINICAGQQQMRTKISSTISNWIFTLRCLSNNFVLHRSYEILVCIIWSIIYVELYLACCKCIFSLYYYDTNNNEKVGYV